ncbi:MAG: helix-turn-helix domain-containing protein, partial [Pseudolabrys sp.]
HRRLRNVGRAEATRFTLPFSQEVMADVLGLSVPHLNRMMQRLRSEKLIAGRERRDEFTIRSRCRDLRTISRPSLPGFRG